MFCPLKNAFTSTMKADLVLTAALEQIRTQKENSTFYMFLPRGVYILCLLENNGEIAARVIIYIRPLVCRPQIQSTATFDSDPVINI